MGGFSRDCTVAEDDQGEHPQKMPRSKQKNPFLTVAIDIRAAITPLVPLDSPQWEAGG